MRLNENREVCWCCMPFPGGTDHSCRTWASQEWKENRWCKATPTAWTLTLPCCPRSSFLITSPTLQTATKCQTPLQTWRSWTDSLRKHFCLWIVLPLYPACCHNNPSSKSRDFSTFFKSYWTLQYILSGLKFFLLSAIQVIWDLKPRPHWSTDQTWLQAEMSATVNVCRAGFPFRYSVPIKVGWVGHKEMVEIR